MILQTAPYSHIQDAIQGVQEKYEQRYLDNQGNVKIKAASGCLIWRFDVQGDVELLLGKVRGLGNDPENVDGTFVTFAGGVEEKDFSNPDIPGVVATAAREVEEETRGYISRNKIIHHITQESIQWVKNWNWEEFCAPIFLIPMNVSDHVIEAFNKQASGELNEEVSEIKWISLQDVLNAQNSKDETYKETLKKIETLAGRALTDLEKSDHPSLSKISKENPQIQSGEKIAHYVARTIAAASFKQS